MKTINPLCILISLAATVAAPLGAQVSVYSVVGFGFPAEAMGVRARSLGGGEIGVDPRSAVNPAATVSFRRLTVVATSNVARRSYEIDGTAVKGLRDTRFPFAIVGGDIPGTRFSFAASFSTYVDRTYDLSIHDTITLRGEEVAVSDRLRSSGSVIDSRFALGWIAGSALSLGLAAHVMSGSARVTAARAFADPSYNVFGQRTEEGYSGFGISAGVLANLLPGLRIGGALRTNTSLDVTRDSEPAGSVDLPFSAAGGLQLTVGPTARWSASAWWRSWSRAEGLAAQGSGVRVFDTWSVGTGIELGSAAPLLRGGVRYSQLPFSPTEEQPREISVAVGSGFSFAAARALADFAVERTLRDGAGASERIWQFSVAVLLQP